MNARILGMCLSLMVAAIALSVAATVIEPYLPMISALGLIVVGLLAWRSWHRSRW